jgi:hypothetical protein
MNWIGKWENQYGSIIVITLQQKGRLEGTFESAVDQTTKGQSLALVGVYNDLLLAITCSGGDHVVTYAGMLADGKLQTAWQVVTSQTITAKTEVEPALKTPLAWWQSVKTNVDTFERMTS